MTKASDGCVFIACDWQDLGEGAQVAAALEQSGLSVWAGPRDAGTADPAQYAAATRDAASRCTALVLLLSGRQVDLAALGELCRTAEAVGKPIYPVRVTDQAFVPEFPALQRAKSWIDATGAKRDAELARLAADLQSLSRPAPAPAVPAWPAAAPSTSWQAPAVPAATLHSPATPYQAQSSWSTSSAPRAGQPRWMSILLFVFGVILLISGIARIFRAIG